MSIHPGHQGNVSAPLQTTKTVVKEWITPQNLKLVTLQLRQQSTFAIHREDAKDFH